MRWIGLFFSLLRRWQSSRRLLPCMISPQICAPVALPPICITPVVSVIPTCVRPLCVFLTSLCFLFIFVPLHFVKLFLSLSCRVVCPFLCSGPYLRPCRAGLWFCRPCRAIHLFGCFASLRFSFDNLSPCDRKFHSMISFLGTVDLGCPLPTNPSEQDMCVFVLIQLHSVVPAVLMSK